VRIVLAHPGPDRTVDGIRDYSRRVVEQLRAEGEDARLLRPRGGLALAAMLLRALPRSQTTAALIQYNPFSWGRWGLAPGLILSLGLARALRPRTRILLCVHEAYVALGGVRQTAMGIWQRAQLRALLLAVHGVVAMSGRLEGELSQLHPARPVNHVPVGSNLPDERGARDQARRQWQLNGQLALATLTTGHESQLDAFVSRAAAAAAAKSPTPVVLLMLGAGAHNVPEIPGVRVLRPGYLDHVALARMIAAADVFLAPFSDGASTRRTSLIAALQHGVATLTTRGRWTEAMLADAGALLTAHAEDSAEFAEQAARLSSDEQLRARLGQRGRALYEQRFCWPIICAGLRRAVAETLEEA